jgi:shikimate kinase
MDQEKTNIVLIGMPGSGKSTVGIILAKMTSKDFIDTDVLIQTREGRTLQDIVDKDGHMVLREIEERVLLTIDANNQIISTGGSAAYSEPAMNHLHSKGVIVFLHADLATLQQRIGNFESRGIAKKADQTFEDLYRERYSLYTHYADVTVESGGFTQEQVSSEIIRLLNKTNI